MSVSITRLELGSFESLPHHTRRCVFWEVETSGESSHTRRSASQTFADHEPYESEFDKEAWISGLLLEWGACGQVAIDSATHSVIGTAFYAPPNRVPRSQHFPTSPVSHDAVLLTSIRTEPGHEEVASILLDAVLGDLIRRGVRAVESFGIVRNGVGATPSGVVGTGGALADDLEFWTDEAIVEVAREILDDPQSDLCTSCMIDASFLKNSGFDVVSSHQRFPRFRLELDEGLGWKFEVESALEKLAVMAEIDLAGRQRTAVPVGHGQQRISGGCSPRPTDRRKCKCP
ncbi:hypothetical protein IA539_16715 [Gordonia sp. zg691]|uniref:GNAT family N-acetyltransferase n=1 Tax=Gordonia jinghuaiqii TaxID=2758710 RepID=A0A7D7LU68_9ACTN|nr:hypothetical protein [Gordonia jinghuaiqii]MBD0862834.1 hypothetical protein [Gordonia jinghuaiqii]MCR5979034.1 hypothetical protein [Gordonia jinghuaiqii]QMT01641.1 hypothetical protein H1R19_23040 [Gordonia jinghuaiqii]